MRKTEQKTILLSRDNAEVTGRLIKKEDWDDKQPGPGSAWPNSLAAIFGVVALSKLPMAVFCSGQSLCLYNEAFEGILPDKATGNQWAETWSVLKPYVELAFTRGAAVETEPMLLPVRRNRAKEGSYRTLQLGPIVDEAGAWPGILLTCIESPDTAILKELRESKNELEFAIDAADLGTWDYNPLTNKFTSNRRLKEWFGLPPNEQIELTDATNAMLESDRPRVIAAIQKALDFSSGGYYEIEYSLVHPVTKKQTCVRAKGRAWFNEDRIAYRFNGILEDITENALAKKRLTESEQRFQAAVQAVEGIVWTSNSKGEMEGEQTGWAELTGQQHRDYLGHGWLSAIHPDDVQATVAAWGEAVRSEKTFLFEHRLKRKDGGWGHFSVRAIPLPDSDGALREWVGVHTDITGQKMAEAKLLESVERYEHLIKSSPFAIGILRSEKLNIRTANQAIIDIWGKGWEIMGKSYFEALPELAEQGYREVFGAVYKTGIPFNAVETPVNILQNGKMQLKYYNFLLYAQRNIQGEVDGIGIIATEVTSQALFNKQIQESEKRFRLLADSIPQLVWTTEPAGRFNYFNQSLTDYTRLTPEQLDQEGWQQLVHPDESKTTNAAWLRSVQTGGDFLLEHRLRNHAGEYRWHLSRAVPQKDETGVIQMWVGASSDIQEQKIFTSELEKQVNERTKELAQNNIELAKMNRELQSFAYISSHDLQEPLRKIQIFASRIADTEREQLSDTGKQYFGRMTEAALRMQTLIDDLLAYSRTDATDKKFEKCDLNPIIEEIKADFQDDLQQKNAVIEATGLCEVYIIPFQFRQLLQNLVSNALKFSSRERPLVINITAGIGDSETFHFDKLTAGVNYCRIRVADNGIGFEQRFSEKIFEVFQRLYGRHEYSGTGIGLAIVKRIAENHGGVVSATGELGKGATFDVYIPVGIRTENTEPWPGSDLRKMAPP